MLWKRFEIKSHQRKARYLKPRRNGRPIPTGGGSRSPPPTLTRVKNEAAFWVPKVFFDFSFFSFDFEHEFARKFKRYHTQRLFRIDNTIESSLIVL